ncbi:MAG: CBS domain-containing protein [Ilumatobacteraceae bacterium]|nr:CBS domain-containing protein [Acidimicrobiales bacterium]
MEGFTQVYDLIGGRATWTAFGLPTEGTTGDRRRIGEYLRTAATLPITATAGDVASAASARAVAIVDERRVLLGSVDAALVAQLPPGTALAPIMVPAPSTIRPELRVGEVARRLRDDSLDHLFVTTIAGVLLGIVHREDLHA